MYNVLLNNALLITQLSSRVSFFYTYTCTAHLKPTLKKKDDKYLTTILIN